MSELFPAPWNLRGRGLMFIYKFSPAFIADKSLMTAAERTDFVGGFGAVMLVDYQDSDCGPYQELLFIPGRFAKLGHKRPSISRIYVSSQSSVINGRLNWGIPKELADFSILKNDDATETWKVSRQGRVFFEARVKLGALAWPIHSAFLPIPVMQVLDQKLFLTKLSGRGWAHRARLVSVKVDGVNFPELDNQKPWFGLHIDPFRMKFNKATVIPGV